MPFSISHSKKQKGIAPQKTFMVHPNNPTVSQTYPGCSCKHLKWKDLLRIVLMLEHLFHEHWAGLCQNRRKDPQKRTLVGSTEWALSECVWACAICSVVKKFSEEKKHFIFKIKENKNTRVLICKGLTMGDLITLWAFPQSLITWLSNKREFMWTSQEKQSCPLFSSSS